ncbi:MAG: CPBP family intramembrane glutamic endopeptidase [Longimicrobiales bacterium]
MNSSDIQTTTPGRFSSGLKASLILFVAFAVWEVIHKPMSGAVMDSMGEASGFLFIKTVGLLLVLWVARGMGHWNSLGFGGPFRPASLLYGLPLMLLAAAPLSSGAPLSGFGTLAMWALLIAIGVTIEEVLCRGSLWNALEEKGVWRTAVITSFAFGSIHLLGLTGSIPASVILSQAVFACGAGFTFAAVRIASGNVWAPIAAHFAFNYPALVATGGITSTFQPGTEMMIVSGGVAVGLVGIGLVAIAKRRQEKGTMPNTSMMAPVTGAVS